MGALGQLMIDSEIDTDAEKGTIFTGYHFLRHAVLGLRALFASNITLEQSVL